LGPGKGKQELNRCYSSWLRLTQGDSASDDYSIFQQHPFANSWRQATFQSVAIVCDSSSPESHSLAQLAHDNSKATFYKIQELLQEVSQAARSDSLVPLYNENGEIEQLVTIAAEIAFQFGIHQSQLKLIIPDHGQTVVIGDEFHHCRDADLHKGESKVVELVTLPGLVKAGDYKSKMLEYTFVPCEIYYTI